MSEVRRHLQERQYAFPYHHIPHSDELGRPRRYRRLAWGLEYLGYSSYIQSLVRARCPDSVLDVGCGDGALLKELSGVCSTLIGVDTSERAVRFAQAFAPDVDFLVADLATVEGRFDVVCLIQVLEHVDPADSTQFLHEVGERVKTGGALVIAVPSTLKPLPAKHYRHFDVGGLVAEVELACPALRCLSRARVWHEPRWARAWRRLSSNRWWGMDVPGVEAVVWRRMMKRHLVHSKGQHVVCVFERV